MSIDNQGNFKVVTEVFHNGNVQFIEPKRIEYDGDF
jgi:hypothetical protein